LATAVQRPGAAGPAAGQRPDPEPAARARAGRLWRDPPVPARQRSRAKLAKVERIGFLILFALIFWVPGVSGLIFGGALALADGLGVPRAAIGAGWDAFHFWSAVGQ
jgi:transposase InsO family protein